MTRATIAFNRFGLGARAQERVEADPRGALLDQLARFDPVPAPIRSRASSEEALKALIDFRQQRRQSRDEQRRAKPAGVQESRAAPSNAARTARRQLRERLIGDVHARTMVAVTSTTPFAERLVHFWANHFAVSVRKPLVVPLAGPHEFDAIRPHLMGTFSDLMRAATLHPAMLVYLDQAQSIGPASRAGQRARRRGREAGLNENLAREIMELHTLGTEAGYSQSDVTEFARALTGWTIEGARPRLRTQKMGMGAGFAPAIHEPGARTILGRRFAEAGANQALDILFFFARHPATARHIAFKLARHFCADDPPQSLVDRLAARFLESGGDLPQLYRALVESDEVWDGEMAKFRTPWDWTIASFRALDIASVRPRLLARMLNELGQPVWAPPSPKGYDDVAKSWAAGEALLRRVELAPRLAELAREHDPIALAQHLFAGALDDHLALEMRRAESRQQALGLLLASPAMMWR